MCALNFCMHVSALTLKFFLVLFAFLFAACCCCFFVFILIFYIFVLYYVTATAEMLKEEAIFTWIATKANGDRQALLTMRYSVKYCYDFLQSQP